MGIAKNRAERIGSTVVQIGSTKLVPNADNDIEIKDTSDVRKKVIASELRVGTGNDIVIIKRDSSTGKAKFETSSDGGGSSTTQQVGGSAIYANPSDLPVSGNSAGDMAFITSTNNLMIHNGSGWYKVATVTNASPTISSAGNASYTFATDGTPVSIEVTASDPEGLALQYKYVVSSGSIGNTAAVTSSATSGGTYSALNANTLTSNKYFKVTPSTNDAHAGTFSLTFSAYDGINTATSSASSFTLAFDVSGSYFFDGTDDYITIPSSSEFAFGTNDFTIEFFLRAGTNTSNYTIIYSLSGSTGAKRFEVAFHNSTIQVYTDTGSWRDTGYTPTSGAWEHFAFQRDYSENTLQMFVDGIEKWSVSNNRDYDENQAIQIGSYGSASYGDLDGYLSNFRIVNGTAVYTVTSQSGGSTLFDGTNDNLSIPSIVIGTNNYTIEFWIYPTAISNYYHIYDGRGGSSGAAILIQMTNTGTFRFYSQSFRISGSTQISVNTWSHIALERVGNVNTLYVNGTSDGTYNDGGTSYVGPSNSVGRIGSNDAGGDNFFPGYISNFRIVVGSAVYNGNFTVPSSQLTAISNTQILTCQNSTGSITDASSNSHTITANGGAAASTEKPFADTITVPTSDLTAITNTKLLAFTETDGTDITAGSTRFDGHNDYLQISSTDIINSLANFTVEAWAFFDVEAPGDEQNLVEFNTGTRIIFGRRKDASGITAMYVYSAATSDLYTDDAAHDILHNRWVHLAWVKEGQNFRMYIDGKNVKGNNNNSATNMAATPSASLITIGMNSDGNERMDGYISNLRISSTARYSADFARPTAAFTSDSNTILLTCQNSTGTITDASSNGYSISANNGASANAYSVPRLAADLSTVANILTPYGDPTHSYVTPFAQGTGGSVLFDGNSDYLLTATDSNLVIGSGDFTAECWIYPTSFAAVQGVIDRRRSGDASNYDWTTYLNTDNTLNFYASGGTRITSSALSINQWYHTAVVKNSGTTTLYVNGVSQGTWGDSATYPSNQITFGAYGPSLSSLWYSGYISNFRLLIGTALYTSNFTVPTSLLTAITNTELLTCQNSTGTITDASSNNISITASGNSVATRFNPF